MYLALSLVYLIIPPSSMLVMTRKHRQFGDNPILQKKRAMARYAGQSRRFNRRNRESPWYAEWSEVLHHRVVDVVDNTLLVPQLTLLYETSDQLADLVRNSEQSVTASADIDSDDEIEEETDAQDPDYDSDTALDEEDLSRVVQSAVDVEDEDDDDDDDVVEDEHGTEDILLALESLAQLRLDETGHDKGPVADESSASGQDPDTSWSSTGTSEERVLASRIPDFSIILFDVQNARLGGGPTYSGYQIHAHRVGVLVECKRNVSKKIPPEEVTAKRTQALDAATFQLCVQAACVFLQDRTVEKVMAVAAVGPWWISTYLTRKNIPFAAWNKVGWVTEWDESTFVSATWSKDMFKLGTRASNVQLGRVKKFLREWNTKLGWDQDSDARGE
jgi:hypothetical protein